MQKDRPVPVVLIHQGEQPYVHDCIAQARRSGNEVVWISDVDARTLEGTGYQQFRTVYVHRSPNSEHYELWCFKRYWILRRHMEENGLAAAWMIDSDVLLYADLDRFAKEVLEKHGRAVAYGITSKRDEHIYSGLAHNSYWSYAAIVEFTEWLTHAQARYATQLEAKWRHFQETGFGNVSDMTYLWLWAQERPVYNLSEVDGGAVFDSNFNLGLNVVLDEYQMRLGHKHIWFRKGAPYGKRRPCGREIRFLSLHFQGAAKRHMARYARGAAWAADWELLRERIGAGFQAVRGPRR